MKHAPFVTALLLAVAPAAFSIDFNTDALKKMQEEGHKIAAQALRSFQVPSGKCLHTAGEAGAAGANVVITNCKQNLANQQWRFDDQGRLANQGGKCLSVAGDPNRPGANVVMQNCGAAQSQKWRQDAQSRLVNGVNKCLHAAGDASTPGGNVVTTNCKDNLANQRWR